MERIELFKGDITGLRVDAIVNAANPSLLPGLGVCGAIHKAAGHRLAFECAKLGGCKPGEAKITPGFRLNAKWVIHTVGPVWRGGSDGEPETLAKCYHNALAVGASHRVESIAFPCIATGIFGYPMEKACPIALLTVMEGFLKWPILQRAVFVCFTDKDYQVYENTLEQIRATKGRPAGQAAAQT